MEAEPTKSLSVSIKEFGWVAAHYPIKRGHTLLAIEQEFHDARGERTYATMNGLFRFGSPNE